MSLVKLNEGDALIDPTNKDAWIHLYIVAAGNVKLSKYTFDELHLEEKEAVAG